MIPYEMDSDELAVLEAAALVAAGKKVMIVGRCDPAGTIVEVEAQEDTRERRDP